METHRSYMVAILSSEGMKKRIYTTEHTNINDVKITNEFSETRVCIIQSIPKTTTDITINLH